MAQYPVHVNRSEFDARPVVVLPDDQPIGAVVHVFTDDDIPALVHAIHLAVLHALLHGTPDVDGIVSGCLCGTTPDAAGAVHP